MARTQVGEREARFRFRVVSSSVRFLLDTFPHAPRLEPCLRLSPHTAQHFRISLGLSSVTFGAEYLYVFHTVCILRVFEPRTLFDVINLYFPWVEFFLAPCADRAVPENDFVSQVSPSWPAFSGVDVVIAEKAFSLDAFLFFFDLILLGVGVVPGPGSIPLGFILGWHDQFYCSGSEGVFLGTGCEFSVVRKLLAWAQWKATGSYEGSAVRKMRGGFVAERGQKCARSPYFLACMPLMYRPHNYLFSLTISIV
jgi:hypothetical protein